MTVTFADYLQLALLALGLIGFGLMMLNRYAVANHNDKLARITSGAANVAGDVRDALNMLPPGADYPTAKAALIAQALPAFAKEFAQSATAIGATDAKLTKIISGQVGQIPPAPVAANSNDPAATSAVMTAVQTLTDAQSGLALLGLAPAPAPSAPAPMAVTDPPPAPPLQPAAVPALAPLVDPTTGLPLAATAAAA